MRAFFLVLCGVLLWYGFFFLWSTPVDARLRGDGPVRRILRGEGPVHRVFQRIHDNRPPNSGGDCDCDSCPGQRPSRPQGRCPDCSPSSIEQARMPGGPLPTGVDVGKLDRRERYLHCDGVKYQLVSRAKALQLVQQGGSKSDLKDDSASTASP